MVKLILRDYRDRDYLLTKEGFYFCVVGPTHPRDRVIAYVKYVPNPTGKWGKGETRFKRVLPYYTMQRLLETFRILEAFPYYLYDSPVFNVKMSAVPLDYVLTHFKPEEKTRQLLKSEELDLLQQKAVKLATIISKESNVSIEYFGITGSILLDIHQEFSDVDILIYGMKNISAVKRALLRLYQQTDPIVHRFDEKTFEKWCKDKTRMYPLTYAEALAIYQRKWGRGIFYGTKFSVHPTKLEEEVTEKYGDRVYHPKGMVKVEATVSDDIGASFLPSTYKVEDVKFLEGLTVEDVCEVSSYEGLYGGIAETNERIIIKGKLERVSDKKYGKEYHRILVGSPEAKGKDYIKLSQT